MNIFKQIFSVLLRIAISVALLFFLFKFQHVDFSRLLDNIKTADRRYLLLVFFLTFFNYVVCLFRWQMLLKAFDIRIPLRRVIISFAGGIFFSSLLPSTIGGDLVRTIDLAAYTKKTKEVVATVFLDRLSGCIGLVIVALAALVLGWKFAQDKSILYPILIITAVLAIVIVVLFNDFLFSKLNKFLGSPNAGKIRGQLSRLHQEIYYFRQHKKILFKNLLLSVLIQITTPLTFYITALALKQQLDIIYFLVFLPIISVITLLPISVGGLGIRENATVFFFAKVGFARDLAGAMSFLNSIFILIYAGIGGLIYVLTVHHRRQQYHTPSPLQSAESQ